MLYVICIQEVGEAFLNVILEPLFECYGRVADVNFCFAAEFVIVAGNNTFDVFL